MAFTDSLLAVAAKGASNTPTVAKNKTRAAVVVDMGYGGLDAYARYQKALFIAGIAGAIVSGYALSKRKSAEARALYTTTLLASLGLSWFTRPEALRTAVAPVVDENGQVVEQPPLTARLTSWLDAKATANTEENPAWENETWSRLSQDVGPDTIPPALKALLIS